MTQPLALLLYEKLLPGSQLANRLQDLGWRVQTLHNGDALARSAGAQTRARSRGSRVLFAVLFAVPSNFCATTKREHIPVIAFAADEALHKEAAAAGATLAVGDAAILQHLGQIIDQALTEF